MRYLLACAVLFLSVWLPTVWASHGDPSDEIGVLRGEPITQKESVRDAKRKRVQEGYRKRYVRCRRLLGLEPVRGRGTFRDVVRCRRSHYRVPEWPWGKLAGCETGRRWHYNGRTGESRSYWSPPSGFDGGLQFHPQTWSAFRPAGYPHRAHLASPKMQVRVAKRVLRAQGKRAWPVCSRRIGWR